MTDNPKRCAWCTADATYIAYHDTEWGFPTTDDRELFEMLTLEAFQAGLSWITILRRREGFRQAFAGFDIDKVAAFTPTDVARLLADTGIIRHRGKIEAAISNAARAQEMIAAEGSLRAFLWRYAPAADTPPQVRPTSPEAIALSKELRKRGWKFMGPTIVYAFMQATGMVNDHAADCAWYDAAAKAQHRHRAGQA